MNILVIGSQGCSRCMIVKNILKSMKVDFDYQLVNGENQKYVDEAISIGISQFPILVVDGKIMTFDDYKRMVV